MSGGRKAVQGGVQVKLPAGVTWDSLAKMSPEEIKEHFEAVNGHAIEAKRPWESREAKPATRGGGYVNDSQAAREK